MNENSFTRERRRLTDLALGKANLNVRRFYNLDSSTYSAGALDAKTKEMLGLVASLVLRCDDCIRYHLGQCFALQLSDEELQEVYSVALVVGGSIVIPHHRRAVDYWEQLKNPTTS